MTVSRHKRRMSTTRAAVFSVGGLGLAAALGVVGGMAIYNTKDGQVQGSDVPEDRLPNTPTGVLAIVDDEGALASLAVFAVRPDDGGDQSDPAGGTLVPVPPSSDVSGGFGAERTPLNETVALFGVDALANEVPALLGVSTDAVAVLDAGDLADTLAPLGSIDVELPVPVVTRAGRTLDRGPQAFDAAAAAELLAPADTTLSSLERYELSVAVWRGVAQRVGDGLEVPLTSAGAPDLGRLLQWLTAGRVSVSRLHVEPITDLALNPQGVDAVALDRAELVTLFGHVAPSRVAAPNPGLNFLVRSVFSDDQVPADMSRYDLAYAATGAILGREGNVLSVDTSAGEAGAATVIEVADDSLVESARALEQVFGPVEVEVASRRVVNIDVVVTLGTDYLQVVGGAPVAQTAATTTPATTGVPADPPPPTSLATAGARE